MAHSTKLPNGVVSTRSEIRQRSDREEKSMKRVCEKCCEEKPYIFSHIIDGVKKKFHDKEGLWNGRVCNKCFHAGKKEQHKKAMEVYS